LTRPTYLAAISDMIWLLALNAGLTFGLTASYVPQQPPQPPPPVLIALGVAVALGLWCGLGLRVQRRGGGSRDVWSAVWRVLLLTMFIVWLSQIVAALTGHALPGSTGSLGVLGAVLSVLVLPIAFVITAIPAELLAQAGYTLAKVVWGHAVDRKPTITIRISSIRPRRYRPE
jgi:hypothetical protein